MQDLSISLEGLEAIAPVGWKRDFGNGYVAETGMAFFTMKVIPMKTSPENSLWTISIDHKYEPSRSVTMAGEDPAVVLSRAMSRFKDNMKIIKFN
jgi:hypothetical protein